MDSHEQINAYLQAEVSSYQEARQNHPRVAKRRFPMNKQKIWYRRINRLAEWHIARGFDIPAALLRPYGIPVMQRVTSGIPLKYQYRGLNTLRELARANVLFPHLLTGGESLQILDLSAGGCGIAEVFGHYGHQVAVNDYYGNNDKNDVGHSYAEIHKELGLTCENFDGRARPYRFDSESFDIVLSYQAIDAYGPVADWYAALDEMLRIARRSVGLILNPPFPRDDENIALAEAFVRDIQAKYDTFLGQCPETDLTALRIDKA